MTGDWHLLSVAVANRRKGTIGARLRKRRLELGYSQRDLSEPGVSFAYISRLESDQRTPSIKALRKLASKLEISVEWLETGNEDPAEQLAELVLEHEGKALPPIAAHLARQIIARSGRG
jgi:transcriptional regulator with XRE-family HTH domain